MKFVFVAARLLLGLIFFVLGLNGFLFFIPAPAHIPSTAGAFSGAMLTSHYMWFTTGVQVICGIMLLANQYVPLALVVLGAVLSNILVFHITMWPSNLPLALFTTAIWVVASWPLRSYFAPLFARNVAPQREVR
jgi:putative oxidoreductase